MTKRTFAANSPHSMPGAALIGLTPRGRHQTAGAHFSALPPTPGHPIPFTFDPLLQPKIIVQVRINGQAPRPFWVDTGLNTGAIIDTRAATQLGLTLLPQEREAAIGAIETRRCRLESFAFVGASPAQAVPIPAISNALVGDLAVFRPSLSGEPIAGMIGIQALHGSAVQFDFTARRMSLGPATQPRSGDTRYVLPMRRRAGDGRCFVTVTLQKGITAELLLDTGSEGTSIPACIAQSLRPAAIKSVGQGTAYGLCITPVLMLPSVQIGECGINRVAVASLPQTPVGFPLGIDLLARFQVTMDFTNRCLLLDKSADDGLQGALDGYSGIHLASHGGLCIVASVDAASPAQRAGVQVGDSLQRIDAHETSNLPLLTVCRLLRGFAGSPVDLTVSRAEGRSMTFTFVRGDEFSRPGLPIDGLFLRIPPGKPMEVVGLLPGCGAAQAGLLQGDVILEFNGHRTTGLSAETLAVEFRKQSLTLKVERKGARIPLITLPAKPMFSLPDENAPTEKRD